MTNSLKCFTIGLLAAALLTLPLGTTAWADEYYESRDIDGGSMIYDTVIIRPIAAIGTVGTIAAYVLSLPLAALGGNVDQTTEKLVKEPVEWTFQRPLGEF